MTGGNPASDKILEIAIILTDDHLEQTIEGPSLAIKVDDEIIKNMDEWNTKTHTESGLLDLCASGVSIKQAEKAIIEFIEQHNPEHTLNCVETMFGMISHFYEKRCLHFVKRTSNPGAFWMSHQLRLQRTDGSRLQGMKKNRTHRAMDDIKESIAELQYLRDLHWE